MLEVAAEASAGLAETDPVTRVHALRKTAKRARSLLRLIEGPARDEAATLRRQISEAARALAGARDGVAMADALADLAGHGLPAGFILPPSPAPEDGAGSTPAEADAAAALAALMEHGVGRLATGQAAPARGALIRGLARFYARARRAGRAVDPHDAEALHGLRKEVVIHRYQMEMAAEWWPRLGGFWLGELQRLREQLGRHHDLVVLQAHLADDDPDETAVAVIEAAYRRQGDLARKALRQHRRLFAETPRAFRRRLRTYARAERTYQADEEE
nr:CHAD domain-containing protein [Ancylobacter crimeensis]